MSGVAVVQYLLSHNAPLNAVVPAARIKTGTLPLDTAIPAISVTHVDSVRRNTIAMNEPKTLVTERVQATLLFERSEQDGADWPGLIPAMTLLRRACPNQHGTVNGVELDSVRPDVEGPDLEDPAPGRIARSQDFIVKWLENR